MKSKKSVKKISIGGEAISDPLIDEITFGKSRKIGESLELESRSSGLFWGRPVLAIYPGVGKVNFVYNDYHSKVSNPNYSRNIKGKHFTR